MYIYTLKKDAFGKPAGSLAISQGDKVMWRPGGGTDHIDIVHKTDCFSSFFVDIDPLVKAICSANSQSDIDNSDKIRCAVVLYYLKQKEQGRVLVVSGSDKYPFSQLGVGDSFVAPLSKYNSLCVMSNQYNKKNPKRVFSVSKWNGVYETATKVTRVR